MKKLIVIVLISAAFINASKPAPRNFPKKVVFGRSFTEKVDLSKSAKKPAAEKPAAKEKAQPKVIAHILLQKASPQSTYTNILFLQQNVSIIERISVVAKDDKKVELYGQTKGYPPQNFKVSTADQQKFQRIKDKAIKFAIQNKVYNEWIAMLRYYNNGAFSISTLTTSN